jgi:hypothetical protein
MGGSAGMGLGGAAQGGSAGDAGSGGLMASAGSGGAPAAVDFTCNEVVGIDSTSEWFTSGFESMVDDSHWQIVYYHPGYVQDWDDPNDMVWSLAPTSPCAQNSTNPDRIIFNVFADPSDSAFANVDAWVTGLSQAVTNFKNAYPGLVRIDFLTMTRAPDNQPCDPSNRMSIVEQYVDDAIAQVVATDPTFLTASPAFFAPSCDVFTDGGPHFSDTGKPIIAALYGDYYSMGL